MKRPCSLRAGPCGLSCYVRLQIRNVLLEDFDRPEHQIHLLILQLIEVQPLSTPLPQRQEMNEIGVRLASQHMLHETEPKLARFRKSFLNQSGSAIHYRAGHPVWPNIQAKT